MIHEIVINCNKFKRSAGCVIYELLTLRKVFDGSIQFEIMKAVIETEPPKLPTLFGSILNM